MMAAIVIAIVLLLTMVWCVLLTALSEAGQARDVLIAYVTDEDDARRDMAIMARHIHRVMGGELIAMDEDALAAVNGAGCAADMCGGRAREAIAEAVAACDVVFLGMPDEPQAFARVLCAFAQTFDLCAKTVVPFASGDMDGMADAVRMLKETLPQDCRVLDPIAVPCGNAQTCQLEIEHRLCALGMDMVTS